MTALSLKKKTKNVPPSLKSICPAGCYYIEVMINDPAGVFSIMLRPQGKIEMHALDVEQPYITAQYT